MADQQSGIAIVGAGVGGLAFAIGLTRHSIPFTIYESAPAFSTVGAGVGLGPNALRAMDLIDKRFRDMYMDVATGNLNPEKKHVMMEAMRMEEGLGQGESWWGHGEWGAPYFERTGAHRKDLLDIMTSLIDKDAVRFNSTVVDIEQSNDQVALTFADGRVAGHAAVIDCGGIRGLARRIVLADHFPEAVEPQYTHKYVYRTVVSTEDATEMLGELATDAKMFVSRDANLSTYPISKGKQVNVVAFKRDPHPWQHARGTLEVDRKSMLEDFGGIGMDKRLSRLLEHVAPIRWPIFDHPTTPTYHSGLLCLLGDAAHASTPHQGAGAGQALEDALILTVALSKLHSTLPLSLLATPSPARTAAFTAAFTAYDEVRRPRAQRQVATARECGELYNLRDPKTGDAMGVEEVLGELRGRFEWLWSHDLEGGVGGVEDRVRVLLREGGVL
ncbi:oxidoreductase [Ascochyta rabiei]|uniref:Oxidoreductase n=1 Tax=Didymella rabiei TaxID=5454 RepID=A0A163DA79_DIDRA|nr:oxidoreductase [Ascochyta rabiei]